MFTFLTPFGRKEHYIDKLLNTPRSLKEIRLYSLESTLMTKWSNYYQTNSSKNIQILISQNKWLLLTQLIQMISYMSSGFIAIILITQGKVLVGSFVAILQSVQRIQGTLNNVTNSLSSIYESSFLIQEFREFLTLREVDFKTKEKIEKVNKLEVLGFDASIVSWTHLS